MALELTASRLLAQFVGVSLYTWTGIIGVMLAGTAVGNALGGLLADRAARRDPAGAAGRMALAVTLLFAAGAAVVPFVTMGLLTRTEALGGLRADRAGARLDVRALLPAHAPARHGVAAGDPAGGAGRGARRGRRRPGVRLEHGRGHRRHVRRRVRAAVRPRRQLDDAGRGADAARHGASRGPGVEEPPRTVPAQRRRRGGPRRLPVRLPRPRRGRGRVGRAGRGRRPPRDELLHDRGEPGPGAALDPAAGARPPAALDRGPGQPDVPALRA